MTVQSDTASNSSVRRFLEWWKEIEEAADHDPVVALNNRIARVEAELGLQRAEARLNAEH